MEKYFKLKDVKKIYLECQQLLNITDTVPHSADSAKILFPLLAAPPRENHRVFPFDLSRTISEKYNYG